ncbi:MAG: hypothetical protein DSM106950_19600 [Stigonema ocellatum SAG 48.90 = DSM 106950]|nr:hypothetical protein [Stigonema ocellatum SAG 48.90 = DSM 106950]
MYQRENLEAMLGLFLEAKGHPLPQHSKAKSASALCLFLNIHRWSTQQVIRTTRNYVLKQILSECPKGRRPMLQELSSVHLEKSEFHGDWNYRIIPQNGLNLSSSSANR